AFALTFYDEVLAGRRFIDATAAARAEARTLGGTSWAAYQCWGDPEWRYRGQTSDAQRGETDESPDPHIEAASPDALVITLETIATRAEFGPRDETRDSRMKDAITEVTALDR